MNHRSYKRHCSVNDCTPDSRRPPVLRRTGSWTSGASVTSKQPVTSTRRESFSVTTVITPLMQLPSQRRVSLPVNKRISLPVIKPRHEKLQTDFYKLKQSLQVLAKDDDGSVVSNSSYIMRQKKSDEHPASPFDDYLQRLKLKEELPWRPETGGQGQKVKGEKGKVKDKKVYFHLDID